ncbi:hypothetical protein N7492_008472 [Penicillium capsulatum]|uniref:Uncharacterized protein n=1 Tax=Penicillium capsulatum TaxID=69766 RepID=A0A9W9LGT5_9EURO|nr:hypothetical protein N7492_008472 [Penicillium capsulatum]KAJ6105873.1 hypothetical protein N7512_009390 [Penicillium capsulatum]
MGSNSAQRERPPTFFFPQTLEVSAQSGSSKPPPNTEVQTSSASVKRHSPHPSRRPGQLVKSQSQAPSIQTSTGDPWKEYEKGIEIYPKWKTSLCRSREDRTELVHIQQLDLERSAAKLEADTIGLLSHRSFPRLLNCYHHEQHTYFVWEPTELSLSQIMGSKCTIRESELVSIVWPVLKGIRYLRDCGRALASLTNDSILFTVSGGVKIAGVGQSCQIDARDMNAVTMKLFALSDIVRELRKKMDPHDPWGSDAQNLPEKLTAVPLNDLLRMKEGELKMLVNIASKTGHYNIKFPQLH